LIGVILNLTQSVDDEVAIVSIHAFSFDDNEMRVKKGVDSSSKISAC